MRYYPVVITLILTLLTSCKKEEVNSGPPPPTKGSPTVCADPPPPITDTNTLKCKFGPGTYWVFQDSISNNIDTLLVLSLTKSAGNSVTIPNNPCKVETFEIRAEFRNDTGYVLRKMNFGVQNEGLFFYNDFLWDLGGQPWPSWVTTSWWDVGASFTSRDSLFFNDRYYKNVNESFAYQFTTVERFNNPTRMYGHSLKWYFNTQYGFLQFDHRDRLTGELIARKKVIARNIIL